MNQPSSLPFVNDSSLGKSTKPGAGRATLLLVDDEPNILSALGRLFRPQGYQLHTASNGADALEILEKAPVDLVISDMRMPGMSGAELLEQVANRWPHTVRVLLTGYSDVSSTIAAINQGQIFRYIAKPWEDSDLRLTVSQGLEMRYLEMERRRLVILTKRQNDELKALNATLEARVKARTEELGQAMSMLELAYDDIKESYASAVQVFASLGEMREGALVGHGRRVGELAGKLAKRLGMSTSDIQHTTFAGFVHDIGKINLPESLIRPPLAALTPDQFRALTRHSVTGQAALFSLGHLEETAQLIRHHHEQFGGRGYPDQLVGQAIPLGARIIAIVNDYDSLLHGRLLKERLDSFQARDFMQTERGKRYDPDVLDAFVELLVEEFNKQSHEGEIRITLAKQLKEGMMLSRDVTNDDGTLLLAQGTRLTAHLIERLTIYERHQQMGQLGIYVFPKDHAG